MAGGEGGGGEEGEEEEGDEGGDVRGHFEWVYGTVGIERWVVFGKC
jgi:hypothetical protein